MTRAQQYVLDLCAQPEGLAASISWNWRAVNDLWLAGLIEKRGVVWVLTEKGRGANNC